MKYRTAIRVSVALGVLAFSIALPTAALAEDPVDLSGAYVLDQAGVLGGDIPRIKAALDTLFDDTGIGLFVVYVDSFTGAGSAEEWADQTALASGLGEADVLLAIATDDRIYQVSVAEGFALSDSQLADIENQALIPQLRDSNWADGAIAFADAMRQSQTSGGIQVWPFLLVGGVAAGGALVYRMVRRGRGGTSVIRGGAPSQKVLDARAGSLLVELDNALKSSEQELGFAVAQFGEEATSEFAVTLDSARTKVAEAFALRQQLDDAFEDSPEQRREWTTRIIGLCEAADVELDAQADAFDHLRELEKTAPAVIALVEASMKTAAAQLVTAEATLANLGKEYSPAAVGTVSDNDDQARQLLELAATSVAEGHAKITAGAPGEAAIAVRTAQSATGRAEQLSAAIETLAADLASASNKLDAATADLRDDIAEATAVHDDELARLAAAAQSALDSVSAAGKLDPISSLARLQEHAAALGAALTDVRAREAQVAKARGSLEAALATARSRISDGEGYLTTRRAAIGAEARTRLSEARRHLDEAVGLATSDPVAALAAAVQASHLATAGTRLAQADVSSFSASSGRGGAESGGNLGGAIIGGIIGGILSGGFGGSSRGGSSGSSGRRGGGGRF